MADLHRRDRQLALSEPPVSGLGMYPLSLGPFLQAHFTIIRYR